MTSERDEYKERMQRLMTTVTELKKERDALAAAGKLALEALESLFGVPAEFTGVGGGAVAVWRLGGSDKPRKAITALRQAGVK